ncbi:hypothetical protein DL89DRAFT_265098 [Linderina pennispora]|uniref:Uncharacterized protein n=1 Tax=Linderina pennispora TaxID=61395 RepID=A0A1Y1WHT2_9FUNG|nr:uncharacterized protein DL89DRAFT_265098 [Linderina pennispora]ORX72925.1 hypothetical protein DL89DRAFT_265098 [Linderina pennispora]
MSLERARPERHSRSAPELGVGSLRQEKLIDVETFRCQQTILLALQRLSALNPCEIEHLC